MVDRSGGDSGCAAVDDALADVLDGGAPSAVVDHLVGCDRCRDVRHEAERSARLVAEAGADYRPPADLVARLLENVDARSPFGPPADPASVTRPLVPAAPSPTDLPPPPAMRAKRPPVLLGIAAVVAAAAVVLLFVFARRAPAPAQQAYSATIDRVLEARREGSSERGLSICGPRGDDRSCRPAKTGDAVGRGERIRTDARTRVKLALSDGTTLALDRDGEVELLANAARSARLVRGVATCDVAHLEAKDAPNARFVLPHGTVEVVGTAFTLTAADDMSLVEVTRGEVRFSGTSERPAPPSKDGLPVRAGQEGRILAGKAPVISTVAEDATRVDFGEEPSANAAGPDPAALPRGLGELKAKKPGETKERDRAVRLARHEVKVRISGTMARTEIDETFANDSGDELEGIYRMPLPPGARIERLALEVDGKLEEGAFVARDRAKAIWGGVIHNAAPEAKVESDIVWVAGPWRDPALLEWQRGNRFDLRIFPIPAHGARRVVLAYTQTLPRHGASRRYVYPLAYDPKGSTAIGDFSLDLRVVGHDPAFGVKARGYPLTKAHEESGERLALSGRDFVPAGDLAVEYALASDASEVTTFAYAPSPSTEPFVAFTLRPDVGPAAGRENRDRLYVLALDGSRSMFGERWTRAVKATTAFVSGLDRRDHVLVLVCDAVCRPMSGDEAGMHVVSPGGPATQDLQQRLEALEPDGAHDPTAAVRAAIERGRDVAGKLFANRPKTLHVLYLGDGGVSAGTSQPDRIARIVEASRGHEGATVTAVGIGTDADGAVLDAIARGGRGVSVRDGGEDAAVLARSALAATRGTALERPSITLPPGMSAASPAVLSTLAEGGELVVVARALAGATSVRGDLVLEGEVAGEKWRRSYSIDAPVSTAAANAFVPRLYASLRIADLEQTSGEGARDEIVRLSREHAVASRYTSLLVLESEAMFKAFGVARGTARTPWTGEEVAEASSTPVPPAAKPSIHAKAPDPQGHQKYKAQMLGGPARSCEPPFVIDATGTRRYRAECLGGGGGKSDPAIEALKQAQLDSSSPFDSGLPWTVMPMRRIWTRSGNLVASTVASSEARITAAEKALAEDPNSRGKTSAVVRAYAAARRLDEAGERLRGWLARDPLDADALALRAELAGRSGDRERELRALGSVVDVRPDDVHAQLSLARALEALGLEERACGHRIAIAEANPKDLDNLARVRRCTSRSLGDLALVGDALVASRSADERAKLAATRTNDDVRGDVQLVVSWDAPVDLDVALVDTEGRRFSWTGAPNGAGEVTVRDAARDGRERVGFVGLPPGTYSVELTRATKGDARDGSARGAIEAKLMGRTVRIPFVVGAGDRSAVGTLTVTRQQQLVPL